MKDELVIDRGLAHCDGKVVAGKKFVQEAEGNDDVGYGSVERHVDA